MSESRRRFDRSAEDIDKMILATESPKDRAILMVLSDVADRLIQHEGNELLMFQEARRMMIVIAFFSNMLLGIFVWYGQTKLDQIDHIAKVQEVHATKINSLEARNLNEDRLKK